MEDDQTIQLISEVQSKLKLKDLVSDFTELTENEGNLIGKCPFPNCTGNILVNLIHDIFRCNECKRTGDLITFATEITGYDFMQALLYLNERIGSSK